MGRFLYQGGVELLGPNYRLQACWFYFHFCQTNALFRNHFVCQHEKFERAYLELD